MVFEWDDAKNESNLKKHGISFNDARSVFADPLAVSRLDSHSDEPRWQIIGHWGSSIMVLVVYTIRQNDDSDSIRIISARQASAVERRQYEKGKWF